jgi:hypothetical protein
MRYWIALAVVGAGALLGSRWALGSPLRGTVIYPREDRRIVTEWSRTERFKGGERACVVVMGDHKPIVPITLVVTDARGQVVAREVSAKHAGDKHVLGDDVAAVVWYPPRDGEYTITVRNHGEEYNDCWIVFR